MVGWHHRLNRHEFEQAPGVGDGQGSPHAAVHGLTESDTTKQLNNKRVSYAPSLSIPLKSNHYTDANHYFCLLLSFIYMDITYRIFSFVSVCSVLCLKDLPISLYLALSHCYLHIYIAVL